MKNNIAKSSYDKIIETKPPKIMKMSKVMNVISISCAIVFVIFLILKLTKVWDMPAIVMWSPAILFGISFIIVISLMIKTMLKDGIVSPNSINQSSKKNNQYKFTSHHSHTKKRKKRRKKR